jgi:hypothetical protein
MQPDQVMHNSNDAVTLGTTQLLPSPGPSLASQSCVRQVQQLVMVRVVRFIQVNKQHPFVRSVMTIPSSRPALRQSAARSGSQGCRREGGGTGGAGAQRP